MTVVLPRLTDLVDDVLRRRQRGHLGEVRHDQHLRVGAEAGQRGADGGRRGAADAGVDLVEHERRARVSPRR